MMFFLSLKIYFILANSADPDEMLPYAAFHLGLHCLPKYLFNVIQIRVKFSFHFYTKYPDHYACSDSVKSD